MARQIPKDAATAEREADPTLLAAAVRAERTAQGLSQRAVATRGNMAQLTVVAVERGAKVPRDFTLRALDRGLGWSPGTAKDVMFGAPAPLPGSGSPSAPPASPAVAPAPADPAGVSERLVRMEAKLDAILALLAASRGPY